MDKNEDFRSMPEFAPLYKTLPYEYRDYERVRVFFKGNEEGIKELLPEPLEYLSNDVEAFVMHVPEMESGLEEYWEAGFLLTAKYKDIEGSHMVCEYVTDDSALCAGREIWGYPKKISNTNLEKEGEEIIGTMERKGKKVLQIKFKPTGQDIEEPAFFPRLQVRRIPKADGPGYDIDQLVIMRFAGDSKDFSASGIKSKRSGTAEVEIGKSKFDPLYKLKPIEVTGAVFTVGDFDLDYASEVIDLSDD